MAARRPLLQAACDCAASKVPREAELQLEMQMLWATRRSVPEEPQMTDSVRQLRKLGRILESAMLIG